MNRFRSNEGFTLVELMVTILVAAIITAAGVTVLLLGLRINAQANSINQHQNTTNILLDVIQNSLATGEVNALHKGEGTAWTLTLDTYKDDGNVDTSKTVIEYKDNSLFVGGSGKPLLTGVTAADIVDGNSYDEGVELPATTDLLRITVTTDKGTYDTHVYCRLPVKVR